MKKTILSLVITFFLGSILIAQTCIHNPSIQAGDLDPAPLINGEGGVFRFTYITNGDFAYNTGPGMDPITLHINMDFIAPANGSASVGGGYSSYFDWSYDAGLNRLVGVQNKEFPGNDGGFITVDFVQTDPQTCPGNVMGFAAEIIPPSCMNGINQLLDDHEKVYACNRVVPGLSVNDVTVHEDDGVALVQICGATAFSEAVSVDYNLNAVSASSPSDYTDQSGTVTIPSGQRCVTVTINIVNDNIDEADEIFQINLSNPNGTSIEDGTGVITILNDDGCSAQAPTVTRSN